MRTGIFTCKLLQIWSYCKSINDRDKQFLTSKVIWKTWENGTIC